MSRSLFLLPRFKPALSFSAFVAILLAVPSLRAQVAFTGSYTQNFDSMGTGTTPPAGWSVKTSTAGSNATWNNTTGIPSSGVASLVATTAALTYVNNPSTTNNNGYNAGTAATPSDRSLALSPTTSSGGAIELQLLNSTSQAFSSLNLNYDIRRFTSVATDNELPGYWLFYSFDNSTWTNFSSLNPTLTGSTGVIVPNSVGVTNVSTFGLGLSTLWNPNATLYLRWVDDNASQTSPDQIIGLDNVGLSGVAAIPEPSVTAVGMGAAALLGLVRLRRKRA